MAKGTKRGDLEQKVKDAAPPQDFKTIPLLNRLRDKQLKDLAFAICRLGQEISGTKFYPYQEEFSIGVIMSVLKEDAETTTALFSRQSGKSETIAVTCIAMMVMLPVLAQYITDPRIAKYKKGFWIGIFGPSLEQADTTYTRMQDRLFTDEAAKILSDDEIGLDIDPETKSRNVRLSNGSFARCHSADKRARIESKSYHLLIIEEAQDVDPFVLKKSISPMTAAYAGSTIQIGTCSIHRSNFYDMIVRNQRKQSAGGHRLHYQYDFETAGKYNPRYKKFCQIEMEKIGYDSDEFRLAYRLHWITERGMLVEVTFFETLGGDYYLTTYDTKNEVVVGIDVGKIGSSTVVTVIQPDYAKGVRISSNDFRCHKKVLNWLELRGDDYDQQFLQITDFLKNYSRVTRIHIDATGVGRPIYDRLCNFYSIEVDEGRMSIDNFEATAQSNSEGFLRLKSDFECLRLTYPDSARAKKVIKQQRFVEQVTNARKEMRGAYMAIESDMDKDFVSSLMLACWAADMTGEIATVEEVDIDLYGRRSLTASGVYTRPDRNRARSAWRN